MKASRKIGHPALTLFCLWFATLLTQGCSDNGAPDTILASGHVECTEVKVSAKVGGTLEWLGVDEGDSVSVGQEVARLDTVDLELALDGARAQKDLADAELRLRRSGFVVEEIAAAQAQVARARIELQAAQRDLDRLEGLLESGSGTVKSRDDAESRRDIAARALDGAEEQYQRLKKGFRDEEIDAARARVAAAEARIAQLEQQIRDATVTSPVAGRITLKVAEQGELLGRGTPIIVVSELTDAWLTAYLAEPDLGRVRLGQEATVVTDDGSERLGRLAFINPQAEFTPKNVQTRDERVKLVYRVKISLDNQDGFFKPGMPAEAHLAPQSGDATGTGATRGRAAQG